MKKYNKIISFALVFTTLIVSATFSKSPLDAKASSVSDLNKKLEQLNEQMKETSKKIDKSKEQKKEVENKKVQIDNNIDLTTSKINAAESNIKMLDRNIANKEKELNDAKSKLTAQEQQYKKRVRASYMAGDASYLEVLFGSADFKDLLIRLDTIQRIHKYDRNLVEDMTKNKEKIENTIDSIESSKKAKESVKKDLAAKKDNLNKEKQKAENYVKSLENDVEQYKIEYAKYEKEEKKVEAEIQRKLASSNSGVYIGGDFVWPLPGHTRISSPYGWRRHPILGIRKFHSGIDLPAPSGTSILAANGGTVVTAQYSSSYGNYIIIDHGGGKASLYAHCRSLYVSQGQKVTKGQKIAGVGTTGWSNGNHLHFEIRINGKTQNPMSFFKKG